MQRLPYSRLISEGNLFSGYFKKAFFENNFLGTAFLRNLFPQQQLQASCEDFSESERKCVCNGISAFAIADPREHGNSESIPALQTLL